MINEFKTMPIETKMKQKRLQKEQRFSELWNKIKWPNIHVISFSEEKTERGIEKLFEKLMDKCFQNLVKTVNLQIWEA